MKKKIFIDMDNSIDEIDDYGADEIDDMDEEYYLKEGKIHLEEYHLYLFDKSLCVTYQESLHRLKPFFSLSEIKEIVDFYINELVFVDLINCPQCRAATVRALNIYERVFIKKQPYHSFELRE